MQAFTVLSKSTPASPRKDVKFSPTWRLAWTNVTADAAQALVSQQPAFRQASYLVVPSDQVSRYL